MPTLTLTGSPTFNTGPPTSCTIDPTGSDRVQAPLSGIDETQGWVAARLTMGFASSGGGGQLLYLFDWRDDANNYIRFWYQWDAAGPGWGSGRKAAGSGSDGKWVGDTFSAGDKRTVIMRWTATEWAQSIAGAAFSSLGNTNIPTLAATLFDIGSQAAASQINSDVIWFAWGSGALVDADSTTINGFGDTDHLPADFPGGCLGVWPAVSSSFDTPAGPVAGPPLIVNQNSRW